MRTNKCCLHNLNLLVVFHFIRSLYSSVILCVNQSTANENTIANNTHFFYSDCFLFRTDLSICYCLKQMSKHCQLFSKTFHKISELMRKYRIASKENSLGNYRRTMMHRTVIIGVESPYYQSPVKYIHACCITAYHNSNRPITSPRASWIQERKTMYRQYFGNSPNIRTIP